MPSSVAVWRRDRCHHRNDVARTATATALTSRARSPATPTASPSRRRWFRRRVMNCDGSGSTSAVDQGLGTGRLVKMMRLASLRWRTSASAAASRRRWMRWLPARSLMASSTPSLPGTAARTLLQSPARLPAARPSGSTTPATCRRIVELRARASTSSPPGSASTRRRTPLTRPPRTSRHLHGNATRRRCGRRLPRDQPGPRPLPSSPRPCRTVPPAARSRPQGPARRTAPADVMSGASSRVRPPRGRSPAPTPSEPAPTEPSPTPSEPAPTEPSPTPSEPAPTEPSPATALRHQVSARVSPRPRGARTPP